MDAKTVMRVRPGLTRFLRQFDDCFGRVTTRRHLDTYIEGQLSDLERKSVEPIADAAGTAPRTLQEFLSLFRWDEAAMRDRFQQRVARRDTDRHRVGTIDETSFMKKGDKTACVQRQHCGAAGKAENCVVSVHLGYSTPEFHTLLDGELYLPKETWDENRIRCRAAVIPDDVVYRPKWQIALEQLRRAMANGIRFEWLTFDEGYGGKPPFLRELEVLGQNYVAEVPADFCVWTSLPQVLYRGHARDQKVGRPRRYPRLKVKNNPTVQVRNVLKHSPVMRQAQWQKYLVKDGSKGPMVMEARRITVWLKDDEGLPTAPHQLLVTRPVLNPHDVKYFISNLFLAEFKERHGGGDPDLTICQIRTVTSMLAPIWARGGRCPRKQAETISAQLTLTQERNRRTGRSHRRSTIRRLQGRGLFLKDPPRCY